jgi:3-oxoadipate enol-lactonase
MPLAHVVTGDGPAVLLLHSTATDRRQWDPQVPALVAAGRRVVRCDLRGYGESPVPIGVAWDDADDVAALLDALGVDRTAVIASSGGGRVAIEFAARHPDRVTALALLCTAVRGHEPSAALREFGAREDALLEAGDVAGATDLNVELWLGPEATDAERAKLRLMQRNAFDVQLAADRAEAEAAAAGRATAEPATAEPATTEPATTEPGNAGPGTTEPGTTAAGPGTTAAGPGTTAAGPGTTQPAPADPDLHAAPTPGEPAEADLAAITAPVLLFSGAHDLPDFREIAVRLAAELPNARHVELPWAGHLPNMERPDLLNPLLLDFLAETDTEAEAEADRAAGKS